MAGKPGASLGINVEHCSSACLAQLRLLVRVPCGSSDAALAADFAKLLRCIQVCCQFGQRKHHEIDAGNLLRQLPEICIAGVATHHVASFLPELPDSLGIEIDAYYGITVQEDQIWRVSFLDYDLGYFDNERGRVEPGPNSFVPDKVLTMCPE